MNCEILPKASKTPRSWNGKTRLHSITLREKWYRKTGQKKGRIPVLRKNQFAERPVLRRFFRVLFLPKTHTGFGAVSFASAYGLIDGNPGTNPLVIRLWRENFIPENSEKRIPQTG